MLLPTLLETTGVAAAMPSELEEKVEKMKKRSAARSNDRRPARKRDVVSGTLDDCTKAKAISSIGLIGTWESEF